MRLLLLLLLLLPLAACEKNTRAVKGDGYVVDVNAANGVATFSITATDGRHVNAEYPTKFVGQGAAKAAAQDFSVVDETHGSLAVRYAKNGAQEWPGTLKLSVCTDERCQIEDVAVVVPLN